MNETFYALVENGVVVNVMVLYPPSAAEFEGAVPCGICLWLSATPTTGSIFTGAAKSWTVPLQWRSRRPRP